MDSWQLPLTEGKAPPSAGARWKDKEWGERLSPASPRQKLQQGPAPTWEATRCQVEVAPRSCGQVSLAQHRAEGGGGGLAAGEGKESGREVGPGWD